MKYYISKIRNGLWVMGDEVHVISQHSTRYGAENALLHAQVNLK